MPLPLLVSVPVRTGCIAQEYTIIGELHRGGGGGGTTDIGFEADFEAESRDKGQVTRLTEA